MFMLYWSIVTSHYLQLLVTSMNLIHSWGVYSIGWKLDGIPGITNGIYNHIYIIGFYNGLCYELCGLLHNFMSIRMRCLQPYNSKVSRHRGAKQWMLWIYY